MEADLITAPGPMSIVREPRTENRKTSMLYTIAIILIILWLLGLVSSYTISGFIHVLLVIAIILILVRIINGQKLL
jgi:hypothetical protein